MSENLSEQQRSALDEIRGARARRERALRDEVDAIEYARSIGLSYAEIARDLRVSRQAVRQIVERGKRP